MDIGKITDQIIRIQVNTTMLHPTDEQRITRLFYREIMDNGWYGADEVQTALNGLPSEFNERIKERIMSIAMIIQNLKDQP